MKYEDKSTSTKRKHKFTLGHTFYIRHIFALCEVWSNGTVRGCSDIFITKYNSDPLSYFTKTSVNWQLLFQLQSSREQIYTQSIMQKREFWYEKGNVRLQLEMNDNN